MLREKFIGAMISHALGDALGEPFEGAYINPKLTIWKIAHSRDILKYTDDTIMMLCIAESIVEHEEYSPKYVFKKYLQWLDSGDLRGIGIATLEALRTLKETGDYSRSGIIHKMAAGNGVAMRITPIALFDLRVSEDIMYEDIRAEAYITHRNELAISGAFATALLIRAALGESNKKKVVEYSLNVLEKFGIENRVYDNMILALKLYEDGVEPFEAVKKIGNTGYVVHTVALAMYGFLISDGIMENIVFLVRAGGDADSNAAVGGAISGAFYGVNELKDYAHIISKLENREKIERLAERIYSLAISRRK